MVAAGRKAGYEVEVQGDMTLRRGESRTAPVSVDQTSGSFQHLPSHSDPIKPFTQENVFILVPRTCLPKDGKCTFSFGHGFLIKNIPDDFRNIVRIPIHVTEHRKASRDRLPRLCAFCRNGILPETMNTCLVPVALPRRGGGLGRPNSAS